MSIKRVIRNPPTKSFHGVTYSLDRTSAITHKGDFREIIYFLTNAALRDQRQILSFMDGLRSPLDIQLVIEVRNMRLDRIW